MALSRIVAMGNGSAKQFAIPFSLGYIRESDVTCRVGTEADGAGNPLYRSMTFITPELVEIGGAIPGNGVPVIFTRTVQRDQLLVDYEDGDIINEENMNTAQKQALMLVHETLDGRFENLQADLPMGGFRVVNLGEPVNGTDASTKNYVDSRIGTGLDSVQAAAQSALAAASSAAASQSSAGASDAARAAANTARDAAIANAQAAAGSSGSANSAANAASNSATTAEGHRNAAATSATNAATSAGQAAGSATAAANSATASATSATASDTARAASVTARNQSEGFATNSSNSATASAGSATASAGSAAAAAASKDLAEKWATNPLNTVVADGKYSAFHWAQKSAESAAAADASNRVLKSGDTMTGSLLLSSPVKDNAIDMQFRSAGGLRWTIGKGDAETGSNVGSYMYIDAYSDTGTALGRVLTLYRNTKDVWANGALATEQGLVALKKSVLRGGTGNFDFSNAAVEIRAPDAAPSAHVGIGFHRPGSSSDSIWHNGDGLLFGGGSTGGYRMHLNTTGHLWVSPYGWIHERFADRNARVQHDGGTTEFGSIDPYYADRSADLPAPWVMTGIRSAINTWNIWIRAVVLQNN